MQLRKIFFLFTAFCFVAGGLFLLPQSALAKGHPVFGPDWVPPGQAKKMPAAVANEIDDVDEDGVKNVNTRGPAWARDVHPSVKGLRNAYRNLCRNGTPEQVRERLRLKIQARGGTVDGIEVPVDESKTFTLEINGTPDTFLQPEESTNDLAFVIKDRDGQEMDLTENYKIVLYVSGDDDVLDNAAPADGTTLTAEDMSDSTGITKTIKVTANEDSEGTASITAVLYKDENENNELDKGEELDVVTVTYTVGEPAVTTGALESTGNDLAFVANGNEVPLYVATTGKEIQFDYKILDQGGDIIDVSEDTRVIWTVKNNGIGDITITGVEDDPVILEKGESKNFENVISSGDDDDSITLKAGSATRAAVSARIKENEDSLKAADICFFPAGNELADDSDTTVSGRVTAFDTKDTGSDGTEILVKSYDGDYYYLPAGIDYETINVLGLNDAIETELEENINTGDLVIIELDDNEEGESGDSDTLTLYTRS